MLRTLHSVWAGRKTFSRTTIAMELVKTVPTLAGNQRPLRIAIILPSHWRHMMGGSQYQVKLLIDALCERGLVDVRYFAARTGEPSTVATHVVARTGTAVALRRYGHFWDYFSLQNALREFEPDVIYQRVRCSLTGIAARYARRSGIPMIWHACVDTDVSCVDARYIHWLRNPHRAVERAMGRYGMKTADYVVVQTHEQGNLVRRNYGIEAHRVISNFHPVPDDCKDKEPPVVVVWIGNLRQVKRPDLFLDLASKLMDREELQFRIIGGGHTAQREQEAFEAKVAELRNTEYLGYMSQEQVNKVLEGAHVLVNTSVVEGFPNTFIQAWMRRVPVLTLGVNPDQMLDTGEMGKRCTSVAEMADTLCYLVSSPETLRAMGNVSRKTSIELYSLRNVAQLADLVLQAGSRAPGQIEKKHRQAPLRRASKRVVSLLNATESKNCFVSFPKSGRTWVRMFLNYYYFYIYPFCVVGRKQKFYQDRIPSIRFSHGGHDDFGESRMSDIRWAVENRECARSIVLFRDPRDVLISYFFHLTKRIPESGIRNNIRGLSDIIQHQTLGFIRIIEFMNAWYAFAAGNRTALIVHYEDIKKNTEVEFIRILNFLGEEEVNRSSLEKAIRTTSFGNMKEAERRAESKLSYLTSPDLDDEDSFKVRKGKVGGYVSYLSEAQEEILKQHMAKLHPDLKDYYLGTRASIDQVDENG